MASLVDFYWEDSKGEVSTYWLTVSDNMAMQVYEEYETPEDVEKTLYLIHPTLDAPQKLSGMTLNQALDKINNALK